MTKIVAFAGRKQSGKTTCSEALCNYYFGSSQGESKIYNFADPLKKDICMNILGLTYDQCYGSDMDKNTATHIFWEGKYLTAREVMQVVGTDLFRSMYNNVWVDATIKKILTEKLDLAIIADCRFPNEVKAVKEAGGVVIKLNRNPHNSNHASETALDPENYDGKDFDLILPNDHFTINEQISAIFNFLSHKKVMS